MKHIKPYKIFENYSKSPEEICEEIEEEILLRLNDEEIEVDAWPIYETDVTYIKVVIKERIDGFDFDVEQFADQFKQLFSTLDEEGWVPMKKDDRLITTTAAKQKVKSIGSHVETTEFDLICPECGGDETSESEDGNSEICDNPECGHIDNQDEFIVSTRKFGTLEELLFLIRRRLDKIQICFIPKNITD